MIEANAAVKTSDGYLIRVFVIGFTRKSANQTKKTCYAKASKVHKIRSKMVEIIQKEVLLDAIILLLDIFKISLKKRVMLQKKTGIFSFLFSKIRYFSCRLHFVRVQLLLI